MMKKLWMLSLLCFCVAPSYAQRNFWRGLTHFKKPAALETNIKSAVSRTEAALKLPGSPHIQITNLPGEPLVKLGGTVDNAPAILSARMLSGQEVARSVFPGETLLSAMYLPTALNTQDDVMFRGLKLYNLKSVKNILAKGMRYKDVSAVYRGEVFFSGWLFRVTDFATAASAEEQSFPVIVKFVVPTDERTVYARAHMFSMDYYYLEEDIRVSEIQDIMVFLEVDGKPDWYKATLEDGDLVFTPAPSRVFSNNELIYHELPATRCKRVFGGWD